MFITILLQEIWQKSLWKCWHIEQIISQGSDQLFYSHKHTFRRSKEALRLWSLHGSIEKSRWRSLIHETCTGHYHPNSFKLHTQFTVRISSLQWKEILLRFVRGIGLFDIPGLKGNWSNSCRRKKLIAWGFHSHSRPSAKYREFA